jgi:hypothetical protein
MYRHPVLDTEAKKLIIPDLDTGSTFIYQELNGIFV